MVQIADDVEEYYYGPYRGWPWPFMLTPGPRSKNVIRYHSTMTGEFSHFEVSETRERVTLEPPQLILRKYYFNDGPKYGMLALNIFICLGALLTVAHVLESLIRYRGPQAMSEKPM